MQAQKQPKEQISKIPIKNPLYEKLNIQHLNVLQEIYKNGETCTVKVVSIDPRYSQNSEMPLYPESVTSSKYCLKSISKEKMKAKGDYQSEYRNVYNEIASLYLFEHQNIIKIYWHNEDEKSINLLLEYGGSKLSIYNKKKQLSEDEVRDIFRQIVIAVKQIHNQGIIHRDLSVMNCVINTQTQQIKIVDFGFACTSLGGRVTLLGTFWGMAPEICHNKRYNNKVDIWSLGIMLYELFHRKNPFTKDKNEGPQVFEERRDKSEFQISETVPHNVGSLIKRMLSLSPQMRPSAQQILSHPWLKSNKFLQENDAGQSEQFDDFSHFVKKESKDHDNRKTKQMPGINSKQKVEDSDNSQGSSEGSFFFDKRMANLTIDSPVQDIEEKLKLLLQARTREIYKRKQLTQELLTLSKQLMRQKLQR